MRTRPILLFLAGCLVAGSTQAALKDKPPQGIKLSGHWKLDPAQSDDPAEQINKADKAEIAKRRREIEDRTRTTYDDDSPYDPWTPGSRDRSRNRHDPFPSRRDDGVTIEGSGVDEKWGTTRSRSVSNDVLVSLDPNPATLTIVDAGNRVSVSEDRLETECIAGEPQPIADPFGDGERRCGWSGRAWVIETKRVERFRRTDRFELTNDGKALKYTSTVAGPRIPTVKVARTYTLVPATSTR
jgi:hypothetical protein